MSTAIKGVLGDGPFRLRPGRWEGVVVEGCGIKANLDRDDFLAAVAMECDVIVIERSELPEVEVGEGGWPLEAGGSFGDPRYTSQRATGPNSPNGRPDWHRAHAIAHLALAEYLAEYLDAHPPVDEAQVEALADEIDNAYGFGGDSAPSRLIARYLVEQGWSK